MGDSEERWPSKLSPPHEHPLRSLPCVFCFESVRPARRAVTERMRGGPGTKQLVPDQSARPCCACAILPSPNPAAQSSTRAAARNSGPRAPCAGARAHAPSRPDPTRTSPRGRRTTPEEPRMTPPQARHTTMPPPGGTSCLATANTSHQGNLHAFVDLCSLFLIQRRKLSIEIKPSAWNH